ncbi:hypothetical protein TUM20985_04240 [Mycobacterium antarcticum]|uniref:DUF3761 domain-containing protein n=1 Tax=unclassified Mycolicibacterium TaxID=2636767 RepID=UPI0023A26725|nr:MULTISPECIES: DUF3761 domain-containing protein [unclassified Mycolicibacterium]BDX29877.1 hypothetical protein TUM20985_04240 [Mycolicibacterium sp. TUM20985]GLP79013.1 hypothetical protein TUM20984_04330 [Mycolicibacterium sp. TUM20984]
MLRLLVASALIPAAMLLSQSVAMADPPACPVTDPPVINRCGWDPTPPPPPSPAPPPPGVSVAMCQDGSISFTQQPSYRGTCAENGGVAKWVAG